MGHGLEYRKGCKQRDHTGGCCSHPEKGWNTNLRYNSEGKSIRIGDYLDIRSKSGASLVALVLSEVNSLSHVWLFATLWTVAYQAPQSMEFFRQEYWSGLPFPSPGDLPNPGIKPGSPALQADALPSEPPGKLKLEVLPFTSLRILSHFPWTDCVQHPFENTWVRQITLVR